MKHNINKTKKDLLGQYMTTNADSLLENYAYLIKGRDVVDPCAGKGDLLVWAKENGASSIKGYDIDEATSFEIRDVYKVRGVDYSAKLIVANPPYLNANRAGSVTKKICKKFDQDDLYKAYLKTLQYTNVDEAIIIIPSNFLFESSDRARRMLFEHFSIMYAEFWEEQVFDDAVIGIMTMHVKRKPFPQIADPEITTIVNRTNGRVHENIKLRAKNKYLNGADFFDYIADAPKHSFVRVTKSMNRMPNSNIVISIMEGKLGICLHYNEGDPIITNDSSFTTYQIDLPFELSEHRQREVVYQFNLVLKKYWNQYDGMFLSNYIEAPQKILSRAYANKLLSTLLKQEFNDLCTSRPDACSTS